MAKEKQISPDFIISCIGCAFHSPSESLLVADLHIGYEAALEGEGFSMPRFQTEQMSGRVIKAIERFDPRLVIVAGDLKHNFDRNLSSEWSGVEKIVDEISSRSKLIVVRGNHDNFLATILSGRGLSLKTEILLNDLKIVHGHETSSPWEGGMVFGHEHPAITLRESTGASIKIPCFLYSEKDNRLVLPAFSPLALGSDIIRTSDGERMVPLLSKTGIDHYNAYGFSNEEIYDYQTVYDLRKIGDL